MTQDHFNLARFLDAQEQDYNRALNELRSGRKRSHWIWYIFPQLRGLGRSTNAEIYGIFDLMEAKAYLAHSILGERLRQSVNVLMALGTSNATSILGELDALKFKSCLTLFSYADPAESIFNDALQRFFAGERDVGTIRLLKLHSHA